jgi:protein SCO1/2
MKTRITTLFLSLIVALPAAESAAKADACCAAETKAKATCCCEGKTEAEKAACCGAKAGGKDDACCAEKPAAKDACCAAMDAAAFSKESLYQLDAAFTDDQGRPVTLGELRGRPVVLAMFFASCNYACPLTVTNMQAIREKLPAGVRERTAFVLVSFDVARDTPAVLSQYRAQRGLDGGWTLLHGEDGAVRELAALLGVKYKQEASGMFSHSNIVTVLNPEGEIAYQRIGLNAGLDETVAALTAGAK